MDKPYVIGIDLGGTTTKFGIVDRNANIKFGEPFDTLTYANAEDYINDLGKAVNNLIEKNNLKDQINGIGIGVPNGNRNDGTVKDAANIPWTKGVLVPVTALLGELTGLPCKLDNDANVALMGEMTYGAAKDLNNFIMLMLGTGLGGGIFSNGQLVAGHNGFAGELGHIRVVRENGRRCGCGRYGCLETYASATGVAFTARELLLLQPERDSLLRKIVDSPITSFNVYEAACEGDELAIEVFNFTGRILGEAICDFIAFSDPETVILSGGLAAAKDFLQKPLEKAIDDNVCFVYKGKTKIQFSQLKGEKAAILGASALAWD